VQRYATDNAAKYFPARTTTASKNRHPISKDDGKTWSDMADLFDAGASCQICSGCPTVTLSAR